MDRLFKVNLTVMAFVVIPASFIIAQATHQEATPGAINSVAVPQGWQFQYDPWNDTSLVLEPNRNQLVLFVWIPIDPTIAVQDLLGELGGAAYMNDVHPTSVAGFSGAEVRVNAGGGSKDWILALQRDGMLMGIWLKTVGEFAQIEPVLSRIVGATSLAQPARPQQMAGRYQASGTYSGDNEGGGLLAESYVTLQPGGGYQSNSDLMGSVSGGSVLSQSGETGARWEVRGDRLYMMALDGSFQNLRIKEVASNGIIFYGEGQGAEDIIWVRQ